MKALLLVVGLSVSASASGLEEAWTGAAVPFECSGNPAVGAFGYGLGVLLMPLACVAGLVTAGWWAVFG